MSESSTPATILRTAEELFGAAAKAKLPQPWGVVASALEAAAGFAADLISHGLDPSIAIQQVRSALPDLDAARREVDALIAQKSGTSSR